VLEHRPQLDIEKLATGEHWYGQQALALKLVDELITSDDYLLKKSANTDIFEINFVFKESLSDKMSAFFEGFMMKCVNVCSNLFRRSRL
jgi:serine protease SohB